MPDDGKTGASFCVSALPKERVAGSFTEANARLKSVTAKLEGATKRFHDSYVRNLNNLSLEMQSNTKSMDSQTRHPSSETTGG